MQVVPPVADEPSGQFLNPLAGRHAELARHPVDGGVDASAGNHIQRIRLRPDHHGGSPIAPLEIHAFVAGRFVHPPLVGCGPVQRPRWEQFLREQGNLVERRTRTIGANPAVQPMAAVVEVADLHCPDVGFPPVPARDVVAIRVHRVAAFLDMDDGGMQCAVGALRRSRQHMRDRVVGVLQGVEGQARRRVVVLEQPDKLAGTLIAPVGQMPGDRVCFGGIVGGGAGRLGIARQDAEVVDQRQPVTVADRSRLVRTVGVEGGEGQFRRLCRVHVDDLLTVAVADDQLPASTCRGQRDRQRRHHAVDLLGVPVRREEAVDGVDQQFVELRLEAAAAETQALRHGVQNSREGVVPCVPGDAQPGRVDLPAVAYRCIDYGLRAVSVRRTFGDLRQSTDLEIGNRKGEQSDVRDVYSRHGEKQPTVGAVVPWTNDGTKQFREWRVGRVFDFGSHCGLLPCPCGIRTLAASDRQARGSVLEPGRTTTGGTRGSNPMSWTNSDSPPTRPSSS